MLKILIADDDPTKTNKIENIIKEFAEITNADIETASDLHTARRLISSQVFDLLILDLIIPSRHGETPRPDGGASFLREISRKEKFLKPYHIIGITADTDTLNKYKSEFSEDLWGIIEYSSEYSSWESQLRNKISYLLDSKRELLKPRQSQYNFDIAIVTALPDPELSSILDLPANWKNHKVNNDSTSYYSGIFHAGDKRLSVIAGSSLQMGMPASAVLAMKMIYNFRPKYLAMAGIAAGVSGKCQLGDILIPDVTWDYGSGKISENSKGAVQFLPDPRPLTLSIELQEAVQEVKRESKYVDEIRRGWRGGKIKNSLEVVVGPLPSGSSVVQNRKAVEGVKAQQRKVIGIEMEAYGIFYAAANCHNPKPTPIAIKSACDFADPNKTDDYQAYAAYTSAQFLYRFALDYL